MHGHHVVVEALVVRRLEMGWLCEVDGRPLFLGKLQVAPGTRMPSEGRRGPVTITVAAAVDLGIARRRSA